MSDIANKSNQGPQNRLDRPSDAVPTIDDPWESPAERRHRIIMMQGDRSSHRIYHSLYEDMLN